MPHEISSIESQAEYRDWVYLEKGDYHKNLDLNWSYAPTYLQKVKLVRQFIDSLPLNFKILDLGCGEGVFINEFLQKGRDIQGLDLNYENEFVRRGNLLELPYEASTFDVVMLLDVFEHIQFQDQRKALIEIHRTLKDGGLFFASIPNLAHFSSRFSLVLSGKLDRTDSELDHPGERPFSENKALLEEAGFKISECRGVTFTVPYLYRRLICRRAKQMKWLHDALEPMAKVFPAWAMLDFFISTKKPSQDKQS